MDAEASVLPVNKLNDCAMKAQKPLRLGLCAFLFRRKYGAETVF